ncbi:uncharacterized protein LOC128557563 isoform X2 [Mercenaria mercenaria]|uniref:uncharacterized protein LOC128557563 isoform X2 n=1 Tax=Mercenaria mercenaria TaxID=6596 RepID=UPI00234F6C01|nr:uncharacterized protein LOC128557563 isoform X2 [Mercenaria mercenaria]
MELNLFRLIFVSTVYQFSYGGEPCYQYNSESTKTCSSLFGWWGCKTVYRRVVKCCAGYDGEYKDWTRSESSLGCKIPRCRGGYGERSCNVRGEGFVMNRSGIIKTDSGGECHAPSLCKNCNEGYYPVTDQGGYCKACKKPDNCNLPHCTTKDDFICKFCVGEYEPDKPGFNIYTSTPDPKRCQRACSWMEGARCFPGVCNGNMILEDDCICASGFTGKYSDCATFTQGPEIYKHMLELRDDLNPPIPLESSQTTDVKWTNDGFWSKVTVNASSRYIPGPEFNATTTKPSYIKNITYGMTEMTVTVTFSRGKGQSIWKEKAPLCTVKKSTCKIAFTKALPSITEWNTIFQNDFSFKHQDRIQFSVSAKNGGYVTYEDRSTSERFENRYPLRGKEVTTKTLELGFDMFPPEHCFETTFCTEDALRAQDILKEPKVTVYWEGWFDDHSGIDKYEFFVWYLDSKGKSSGQLERKYLINPTPVVGSSQSQITLNLNEQGPYSIEMIVNDTAGNEKAAQRIILFDNASVVEMYGNPLKVAQASSDGWINKFSTLINVMWPNRFRNIRHYNGGWLNGVKDANISRRLDDRDGRSSRTVEEIFNIKGIVRFEIAYHTEVNGQLTYTNFTPVPDKYIRSQNMTYENEKFIDGKKLTYKIRAFDIVGEFAEDNVTVMIDLSPPVIQNLWLTKGTFENISVHSVIELTDLTIEWLTFDYHSGIHEVSWKIFDNFTKMVFVHGQSHEPPQGEAKTLDECKQAYRSYPRGPNCYCSPYNGCFHRHYQIKPPISVDSNSGLHLGKERGEHDYDYFIEVVVKNNAGLITVQYKKITIDASPPHEGTVYDGIPGNPETDFQQSLQIAGHWDEFFDKESSVWFYTYGFSQQCLQEHDLDIHLNREVNWTYASRAEFTAQKPGTYHLTVMAYNHALDHCKPVCSDGVTIDVIPAVVSEIIVKNAVTANGLVKSDENETVYVLHRNRELEKVLLPSLICKNRATTVSDSVLKLYPHKRRINGTKSFVRLSDQCDDLYGVNSDLIAYITSDFRVDISWNVTSGATNVHDFEVGISSENSGFPDVMDFTTSHQHQHIRLFHPNIFDGEHFYVLIKAITKSSVIDIKAIGPFLYDTAKPEFTGAVNLTVEQAKYDTFLIARWAVSAFTDHGDPKALSYEASIGSNRNAQDILPFNRLSIGGSCNSLIPPTCTAFSTHFLPWHLHGEQYYFVTIKVRDTSGHFVTASSNQYKHNIELASKGVVQDVVGTSEQFFDIDDIDYQISTSKLTTRWSGFEHPHEDIIITVCISNASSGEYMTCESSDDIARHVFTGLNLKPYETYYHTVIAETEAGNITAVSDGVTVVIEGDEIQGIQVFDGPQCNYSNNEDLNLTTSHHFEDTRVTCKPDKDFQSSTNILQAHWNIPKKKRNYLKVIYWAIEERAPIADIWKMRIDYQHLRTTSSYLGKSGLSLSPGRTYRISLKLCADQFCFKPVHSDGVTVVPNPPLAGNISVAYTDNKTLQIKVSVEPFKDSDIEDLSQSRTVMDHYEWAFADESKLGRLLTKWQRISPTESLTDTLLHFVIDLNEEIAFTKCWILALRGYTKAGLSSTSSSEIRNCQDLQQVRPSVVIDAVGEPLSSENAHVGNEIFLEQNDVWKESDKDYTPYNNIISAVWPTLRHAYYTWAVLLFQEDDPTVFYDLSNKLDLKNPCEHPDAIKCGRTVHEFINVKFEPGELKHGNRYIVCVHANTTHLQHEFWEQKLEEINQCSNGVTVDITPPVAADVWIGHTKQYLFQTSTSELSVNWNSFIDVEEEGFAAHASGITHYEVALGTSAGGIDVQPFTNVGLTNHKTFHNLKLQNGHTYFATVTAYDFTGQFSSSKSEGIKIDTTPPQLTEASITIPSRHISNTDFVEACWTGVFSDLESGISHFSWAIGTQAGYADIFMFDNIEEECAQTPENKPLTLKEGHAYFVTVEAYNAAGLYTATSSWAITVEATPPVPGKVYDGPLGSDGSCVDVDYLDNRTTLQAHWKGFHDPHSAIVEYFVNIGSCKNCGDVMVKQPVGTISDIKFTYLQLSEGLKYFVTVTACNTANLCSAVSSDGFVVDSTPPVKGIVIDGPFDDDVQYQASRNYLGCKWEGFTDSQSDISHYVWRVGTTKGVDDILPATNVHKHEEAFIYNLHSGYGTHLPKGMRIYCSVRAYNKAGKFTEASSNGFIVDDTPPTFTTKLSMSPIGTIKNRTTVLRTTMKLFWDVEDSESFIESQHLSISSRIGGDFNLTSITIEGIVRDYTFTDLDFHDGSYYCFKLISCNGANLCTESVLADILVDSTRPKAGTFAINTDHAAALNRQPEKWMTWTPVFINLAWLGFKDVHSDIHIYTVNIGSQYMGNDLNEEPHTPMNVQHSRNSPFYEDGKVQTFKFRTQRLRLNKKVYISVSATNHVGLTSTVVHSQFNLLFGGIMELVRRCDSYSCLGHCVCAPHGNICRKNKPCNDISDTDDTVNTIIEVRDYLDLRFPDDYPHPFHSPINTMLAAKWSVKTLEGVRPVWYEWSVGESVHDTPLGVFDTVTDRVWHDAGQDNSCIFTVDRGRKVLEEHKTYSVFVRVWYNSETYAVFKSVGVTIYHTPPLSVVIKGKSVKEVVRGSTRDVDFFTRNTQVEAHWSGKFGGDISRYHLYISTHPGGHDLHIVSKTLHSFITSFNITGFKYEENTKYYTVVQAFNLAGLHTTEVSDGFMLDVHPPTSGIVMDGFVFPDKYATAVTSHVQSFWHGFSDIGSGIQTYEYCVSSGLIAGTCDIKPLSSVGIATNIKFYPKVKLEQGTLVRGEVRARDVVGHVSELVSSNGMIVDTTAPVRSKLVECQQNILQDSSFENVMQLGEIYVLCDNISDSQWNILRHTCVSVVKSNMAQHGAFSLHLQGSISQTINTTMHSRYRLTFYTSTIPSNTLQLSTVEGYTEVNAQRHIFIMYSKPFTETYAWQRHVFFFHSDSNITKVEFGTVKSLVAFALDGIQFQLCEVSSTEAHEANGHVNVHTVFVHDWSSIHADWAFTDPETDILEYMWAIGTVQGGTQLQPFVSVGRRTFASNNTLRLEHDIVVFITVVAVNAAGLRTVSYSDPIMIDLTAPECNYVNDGPIFGQDLDFIRGLKLDSHWDISDPESGIKECQWALGTFQGDTSIQAFFTLQPDKNNASKLFEASPSDNIFVTVRCTNGAGLTHKCYSDGVRLLQTPPSVDDVILELLTTSLTQYETRSRYHGNNTEIRFRWTGFKSDEGVQSYLIALDGDKVSTSEIVESSSSGYSYASFTGLTMADGEYTVSVTGINEVKMYSQKISDRFVLVTHPPSLTGSAIRTSWTESTSTVTASWDNVFVSTVPMYYEVSARLAEGGEGDLVQWQETVESRIEIVLDTSELPDAGVTVHLSVRAISYSGLFTVAHNNLLVLP